MSDEQVSVGPLQLIVVGFETTERFRGDAARELLELRGRGMLRVLDARLFHRATDTELTEVDLGALLTDRLAERANPVARLLGVNGAGGNGRPRTSDAFAHTAGFALEDLRRLTDEIGPGEHAVVVLVEHLWAARLRETVREAGGRLVAQGFLTPEVVMVVGAELQARAEAQAAIELANAVRGSALLEALATFAARERPSTEDTTHAAAEVVRVLVAEGFVHEAEAPAAIDALMTAGLIEAATHQAVVVAAEEMLSGGTDEPSTGE